MPNNLFRGKPVKSIDLDTLPEYADWVKDGWVYGYLIGKDVIVGEVVDFEDEYFNTEFWCRVRPESVGQFTGELDKNGKELFKGDIVWAKIPHVDGYIAYPCICEVVFAEGACFLLKIVRHARPDMFKPGRMPEIRDKYKHIRWAEYLTVIGNITDNPELLETNLE